MTKKAGMTKKQEMTGHGKKRMIKGRGKRKKTDKG